MAIMLESYSGSDLVGVHSKAIYAWYSHFYVKIKNHLRNFSGLKIRENKNHFEADLKSIDSYKKQAKIGA